MDGNKNKKALIAAFLLIATGVIFRFTGLDFDKGTHLHPDERFMTMVVTSLKWPSSLNNYFLTGTSPLNPANQGHSFYVYGDLPLFMAKAAADLTGTNSYDDFPLTGRIMAALADSGTIALTFLIGSLLFSYRTGLWAAALYSLSVLPIQLSHFFTSDPFMNLFLIWAFYMLLKLCQEPDIRTAIMAGLLWGAALSCKISAICLGPVIAATYLFMKGPPVKIRTGLLIIVLVAAFASFRLLNPYAFDGPFWSPSLSEAFISNIKELATISRPFSGFPPSLQWAYRPVLIYGLENMVLWGTGTALAFSAASGCAFAIVGLFKKEKLLLLMPILFCASVFALIALHPVQTMRYFLPVYPFVAIFAAHFMERFKEEVSSWTRWAPLVATCLFTLLWATAFHTIYQRPMTRIEASRWIKKHVPAGSTIATETWDDSLPLGGFGWEAFKFIPLDQTRKDDEEKIKKLAEKLEKTDFLVISSNRNYAPITRLRHIYPATARFYDLLFGNTSGFHLEMEFFSYPSLGPISFPDDNAEEAFTVYDHPRVFIFKKTKGFSRQKLERKLLSALTLEKKGGKQAQIEAPSRQVTPVTLLHIKEETKEGLVFLLRFVLVMAAAGLAGSLISNRLFPGLFLPGRSIFLVAAAFVYSLGLKASLWPAHYFPCVILIIMAGMAICQMRKNEETDRYGSKYIFWTVFIFFLVLRAHNPAIFWGERPFDFALLNSVTRASQYPPMDPWFSGSPLRYHAWGQFFIGFMGRLCHIPNSYLYNLGTAVVPALAAELFYWCAAYLGARKGAGIFAMCLLLFSGNLSAWFMKPWQGGLGFDDFWSASRIVPDTINEFPFWTSVFGDLHGHFINMIFTAMFLCCLVIWSMAKGPARKRAPILAGIALGAISLSNPWAVPVYLYVLLAFSMTSSVKDGVYLLIASAVTALLLAAPLWSSPAGMASVSFNQKLLTLRELFMIFGPFLGIFTLWFVALSKLEKRHLAWLVAASVALLILFPYSLSLISVMIIISLFLLWKKPGPRHLTLISLLITVSLVVLTGTEIFTLCDRMNTVFKFHFEVWGLLSLACGVILSKLISMGWKRPAAIVAIAIFASTFLTSLCVLKAWWQNPKVQGQTPSLDGLQFLIQKDPNTRKAVSFLSGFKGQPVIAEAFGPSYGPFGRISSFTGLPTVIGWEYHVYQHGHSWQEIKRRKHDLELLYKSGTVSDIEEILKKYKVKLVMLGALEKSSYGSGLAPRLQKAGLVRLFKSGKEEIWSNEKAW